MHKIDRETIVQPGTHIGLLAGYGGESEWPNGKTLICVLERYCLIQRRFNLLSLTQEPEWDTAAIAKSVKSIKSFGHNHQGNVVSFEGSNFLLSLRSLAENWKHDDPLVHVYGWMGDISIFLKPVLLGIWLPQAIWLSHEAVMTIEEPDFLSEVAKLARKREGRDL